VSRFAKGGVIRGPENVLPVYVRRVNGRREYWEPELGRWVPIIEAAEIRELGREALESFRANLAAPEHELADDYERNEHQ
jgi:hypothetical protein